MRSVRLGANLGTGFKSCTDVQVLVRHCVRLNARRGSKNWFQFLYGRTKKNLCVTLGSMLGADLGTGFGGASVARCSARIWELVSKGRKKREPCGSLAG
mgnify:CR=1 FL=1